MSDEILKLVWIIPVMLWAIATIIVGIFKDITEWVKEKN